MNELKRKSLHAAILAGLGAAALMGTQGFHQVDLLPPSVTRRMPRGNIGRKARAKRKAARASRRYNLRRSA